MVNKLLSNIITQDVNNIVVDINTLGTTKMKQLKTILLKKYLFNHISGSIMIGVFKKESFTTDSYASRLNRAIPYYVTFGLLVDHEHINRSINAIMKVFNSQDDIKSIDILISFDHIEWIDSVSMEPELHNNGNVPDYPDKRRLIFDIPRVKSVNEKDVS